MSNSTLAPEVLNFIQKFTLNKENFREQVVECFTSGNCFWFAFILSRRFAVTPDTTIMYCSAENHFATRIDGRVYDITGDVTDNYTWEKWYDFLFHAPSEAGRIITDCMYY